MSEEPPPLFVACETNNLELLIEALKSNNVDTLSPNQSFTPLMVAANRGALKLVDHLLSVGANVNAQSEGGFTALILSVLGYNEISALKKFENDNSDPCMGVIKRLLESGADVNLATDGGNTALQESAMQGVVEITKLLLDAGAHINAMNKWNETALFVCASKNGSPDVAKVLLTAGADATIKDIDGLTALDMANKCENVAVADLLR
jgi:ankyrin repeat protein